MSDTAVLTTPQDQVDILMNQVADEAGMEMRHNLGKAKVPNKEVDVPAEEKDPEEEEDGKLAGRLRALRVGLYLALKESSTPAVKLLTSDV